MVIFKRPQTPLGNQQEGTPLSKQKVDTAFWTPGSRTPSSRSPSSTGSPFSRNNGARRLFSFEHRPYVLFFLAGMALMYSLLAIRSTTNLYDLQTQNHAVSAPNSVVDVVDNPLLQGKISDFTQTFRNIVQKKVNMQTASWYRHIGPFREESSINNARPIPVATTNTGIDDLQATNDVWRNLYESLLVKKKESSPANDDKVVDGTLLPPPATMVWDKESDIPIYFEQLYHACTKRVRASNNFTHACFDFLQSLIHKPRCTVHLDSRFRCSGDSTEPEEQGNDNDLNDESPSAATASEKKMAATIDAKSLIQEHFTSDTINIVILGGGPVGLYFANAMTELQQQKQASSVAPLLRILVIEKRVHQEGYKKSYERDWVTGICNRILTGAIDERIISLLTGLFSVANKAIPLNAWETLLLLSNRNRGVKFLYGDANDYHEHLYQVPNLVVFDATGHRLDRLDRGEEGNNDDPTATARVSKWRPASREMHRLAKSYWGFPLKTLKEQDTPLELAFRSSQKSGSLVYPVNDNKPYDINMIKILNLPQSKKMRAELQEITDEANKEFFGWWTGPFFPYYTEDFFRPDVARLIRAEYPGFPTGSIFIALSPEQGHAMQELMKQYSNEGRRGELALAHVPAEAISSNPALEGHVGEALLLSIQYHIASLGENGEGPIVSWFRYRPYMYDDPVVPGGYDILGRHVPLLRIGDSLFTGDPNAGSGFESHMQAIRFFQCRLANLSGGSCEWKALEGGFEVEEDDFFEDRRNRR